MWSGYVNVTDKDYLFYWFFENQKPMPPVVGADGMISDAQPYERPLIIWSNGGPGCSAMEGATTENGPLRLLDVKKGSEALTTHQLTDNWASWNQYASVLYVDQPRYVGFSMGSGPKVTSSKDAGIDFVQFVLGFMELFPEYRRSDVFLSSESYGGHFVPAWADAVMDYNEQQKAGGSPLGSSDLAVEQQRKRLRGARRASAGTSAGGSSKIDDNDAIRLRGLIIGNGAINSTVQNADTYEEFLRISRLLPDGYTRSPAAATPTPSAPAASAAALTPGQRIYAVKKELDAAMEAHVGYSPNYYDYRLRSESCPACVSYNYTAWSAWFLRPEVTKALNVCGDAGEKAFARAAAGCIAVPGFDAYDSFAYSAALGRALDKGISVTMYYGKQDRACDFVGGYAVANTIEWGGRAAFAANGLDPLVIGGQESGQWKSHGGLTFVQVDGAGHMVPLDQPAAGAWIANKALRVNVRDS
jgi:pimeloyl-ACP methyl ester carboxylesterase